ncbi:uncharacterized protein LOC119563996 isoform X2 [Chelonia mydas]|uniref:uncharacterized protein LOC119563996 isoform X2 n=1 Tax=Chelonia mydas TaxID=8469 RepID=UPI001CA82EF6|nr:uncharacterized protein LOC119563996 isoform X2 [Chelonia mydas]
MLLRMLDPSKDSGLLKRKFCIERNGNSKEKGMTSDISITHIFGQCMLLPKRSIMVLTQNEQRKQKAWKSQLHVKYRRKILHTPLLSVCVSRFPDSVPKIPLLPPLFPSQPPVPLNSAKLSYQLTISDTGQENRNTNGNQDLRDRCQEQEPHLRNFGDRMSAMTTAIHVHTALLRRTLNIFQRERQASPTLRGVTVCVKAGQGLKLKILGRNLKAFLSH